MPPAQPAWIGGARQERGETGGRDAVDGSAPSCGYIRFS